MKEPIVDALKIKFSHHIPALVSSCVYILAALVLQDKDILVFGLLILVFLTSIFYHSHPENKFFRLADWVASLSFIIYIFKLVITYGYSHYIFGSLGAFCIIFWIISEIAYVNKFNTIFNISHTLWHIFSALAIFMVVFSI